MLRVRHQDSYLTRVPAVYSVSGLTRGEFLDVQNTLWIRALARPECLSLKDYSSVHAVAVTNR